MKPAYLAVLLSLVAAALLLLAGPGTRMEWWDFRTGFQLMRWAAYTGLAAAALAAALVAVPQSRRAGLPALLFALVLGLLVAYVPWHGMRQARSVPPIHDISTDTAQPPPFVAVLPLRANAPNPAEYEGVEIARQQLAAYPDITTKQLPLPPDAAFARALAAAGEMGWEIVDADAASGRIEATDTTFWFGFKDDVVIRVAADGGGSKIDVRSVSRVGGSDVGTNANRIRAYLERLGG